MRRSKSALHRAQRWIAHLVALTSVLLVSIRIRAATQGRTHFFDESPGEAKNHSRCDV
jgi:hypothetical protein